MSVLLYRLGIVGVLLGTAISVAPNATGDRIAGALMLAAGALAVIHHLAGR